MPELWEGCFIGDKGDMLAALRACPRLMGDLRRVGWDELRALPLSSEHTTLASKAFYHSHTYAEAFLESLGGIELVHSPGGNASTKPRRLAFSLDDDLESHLGVADYYVMQLLGQTTPFPVATVEDFIVFVDHTAQKNLLLEREFRTCYRSENPFKLIEYIFYGTTDPAVTAVPLCAADVPPEFRRRFA